MHEITLDFWFWLQGIQCSKMLDVVSTISPFPSKAFKAKQF